MFASKRESNVKKFSPIWGARLGVWGSPICCKFLPRKFIIKAWGDCKCFRQIFHQRACGERRKLRYRWKAFKICWIFRPSHSNFQLFLQDRFSLPILSHSVSRHIINPLAPAQTLVSFNYKMVNICLLVFNGKKASSWERVEKRRKKGKAYITKNWENRQKQTGCGGVGTPKRKKKQEWQRHFRRISFLSLFQKTMCKQKGNEFLHTAWGRSLWMTSWWSLLN